MAWGVTERKRTRDRRDPSPHWIYAMEGRPGNVTVPSYRWGPRAAS
jgi:hypothetical protein